MLQPDLVPGVIAYWSGLVVDIPSGWFLCDGNNGTPDLRDQFVIGASPTLPPGSTGGSVNHYHTISGSYHMHQVTGGSDIEAGTGRFDYTSTAALGGSSDVGGVRPPYYALCFIMFSG